MKIRKNTIKNQKAITLIALVVTIIILLIFAGVTIGFAMNGTRLFDKAKLATDEYNNKAQQEEKELGQSFNEIDNHILGLSRNQSNATYRELYFDQQGSKEGTLNDNINNYDLIIVQCHYVTEDQTQMFKPAQKGFYFCSSWNGAFWHGFFTFNENTFSRSVSEQVNYVSRWGDDGYGIVKMVVGVKF